MKRSITVSAVLFLMSAMGTSAWASQGVVGNNPIYAPSGPGHYTGPSSLSGYNPLYHHTGKTNVLGNLTAGSDDLQMDAAMDLLQPGDSESAQ